MKFEGLMRLIELKRISVMTALFAAASCVLCVFKVNLFVIVLCIAAAGLVCGFLFCRSVLAVILSVLIAVSTASGFKKMEAKAQKLCEKTGKTMPIEGEVWKNPEIFDKGISFVMKTENGLVYVTAFGVSSKNVEIGDIVSFTGTYAVPDEAENDYAFNRRNYLYSMKVFLTAEVEGDFKVQKSNRINMRILAGRVQKKAVDFGKTRLSEDSLGMYGAVSFGDKRYMSSQLKQSLSAAGLNHIAAVSGMHLSIVVSVLGLLLYFVFGKGRESACISIAAILAFSFVTGFSPSVKRACIMSVIYMMSKILYRESDGLSSLGTAVTLMLALNPMQIYSSGFRLSVLATLGILVFMPLLTDKTENLPRLIRLIASAAAVSISAQICVLPELAVSYHSFSAYFLLSNLVILPLLYCAVPMGILLPVMGRIPVLGNVWVKVCSFLFGKIVLIIRKIGTLPSAEVKIGSVNGVYILTYIAFAVMLYFLFSKRKTGAVIAALSFIVLFSAAAAERKAEAKKEYLSFLNMGKGDCAVFLMNKATVVLDCADAEILTDYLTAVGRFKIDALVITSDKEGRMGGAEDLILSGIVKRVYIHEKVHNGKILRAAMMAEVPIEYYGIGSGLYVGKIKLTPMKSSEDISILAQYNEKKILLCSDGYTSWCKCDVVRLPGKGKYNCMADAEFALPKCGVLSSRALDEDKSKPANTLKRHGIPVFVTGRNGTVTISLSGLKVKTTR